MVVRLKRKVKKIEMWAKLMPTGIQIPNAANRNRIALEAQKVPSVGVDIKLSIEFATTSKSSELVGFYFGAVLPLWVAHNKNLLSKDILTKDPLYLKKLVMGKRILKKEVDNAHEDFMSYLRPTKRKNLITKKMEHGRQSLAEMSGYEASLYIAEVYQHVVENTGTVLQTEEFRKARDTMELVIQHGKLAIK